MISKSKGDWAYSMLDVSEAVSAELVAQLEAIDGVVRVRIIK